MPRALFITSLAILVLIGIGCSADHGDEQAAAGQPITPVRLVLADNHRLLFSDYQAQTVQIVNSQTLARESEILVDGHPLAVGFYEENIFVGNETRQCVEVYSSRGEKLFDLGDGPGSIPVPNDLAIDSVNGRVFVVDRNKRRIAVFSVDGSFLYDITDSGLIEPNGVALDTAGKQLFVSHCGTAGYGAAVLVFDYDGAFVRSITGNFSWPQGLALDANNHLFVVDSLLGQVLVFDLLTGQEISRLGNLAEYAGPHKFPLDVAFDDVSQNILVTDFLLGEIESFSIAEIFP